MIDRSGRERLSLVLACDPNFETLVERWSRGSAPPVPGPGGHGNALRVQPPDEPRAGKRYVQHGAGSRAGIDGCGGDHAGRVRRRPGRIRTSNVSRDGGEIRCKGLVLDSRRIRPAGRALAGGRGLPKGASSRGIDVTPDDRIFLKRFFQSLSDQPLDPSDKPYVPLYEEPGLADEDPVKLLADGIEWTSESVQLLSGYRGTGKSTELRRLKARLEESGYLVFLCDVEGYLNLSTPIDVSDFLMVVAGAFGEEVNRRLEKDGHQLHEAYWERFRTFWSGLHIEDPKFSASFGTGPVSVGIQANLKSAPVFKEQLQKHMAGHLGALVADVRTFLEGCVKRLRECCGDHEVVLLLDSIEHIRGTLANAEDVHGSVERLFAGHSEKLHLPGLHVIYTVPTYLKIRYPNVDALYEPGGLIVLPAFKLFEQDGNRTPIPANFDAMERVIRQRGDWRRLLGNDRSLLDRLIRNSGGHLRDLLHLLSQVLLRARELPVPERTVDAAISQMRSTFLPIPNVDALWLDGIADSYQVNLEELAALPSLSRFFDTHLVLCYRNGEEWYDVHPLVREHVRAQAEYVRRRRAQPQ